MKLWIFDLDGTLTDSFPVFFRSMREIFAAHGKSISDEELRIALGSSMPAFFTRHLGAEHVRASIEELRRLSVLYVNDVRAYDGIHACLDSLRENGREIAVWTARDRDSTQHVLRAAGLEGYAREVVTGCCVSRGKPDPEGARIVLDRLQRTPRETLMIGDHLHDVSAARAAGMYGVRASWNPYWEREACGVADRQFFTVGDFAGFVREATR
jgi:HAD superfamily hydrolase (TIGR01509 family)